MWKAPLGHSSLGCLSLGCLSLGCEAWPNQDGVGFSQGGSLGRDIEGNTRHCIRKLRPVPTGTQNIQSLQRWGGQLKGQWRRAFEGKYGNLLSLVNIEVQPAALSTLTQYYDPPLRCFTFQGFQLAPIFEEYKRLIGIPYDKSPPYLFRGHYPSWASMAKLLKVPESEMLKLKKNRNGVEGIPKAALEERLQQLQEEED
ncbi:hypothetical protein CR513_24218, partial [Mucuna pruriens]